MKTISQQRRLAFEALLDDDSEHVRKSLLIEFKSLGVVSVEFLRTLSESSNYKLANAARGYLGELLGEDTIHEFEDFIQTYSYDLEKGVCLLAKTVYPMLCPERVAGRLDELADRCRSLIVHPSSEREQCKVINRVLFEELGFYSCPSDEQISCSNLLSDLAENHRGSSVSLAVLYILVARRCGLALHPVIENGRCYVGCFTVNEPFYLDVVEKGTFKSADQIRQPEKSPTSTTEGAEGGAAIVPKNILMPSSVGDVLYLNCQVLKRQYKRQNNHVIVNMFANFIRCFEKAYQRHDG